MPWWRRSRSREAPAPAPARLELPPLDEALWEVLRRARWRRATGRFLGRHGACFRGFAAQFSDLRPYAPGDDLRFLDQRYLARTDRDVVRLATIEANMICLLVVDGTRSMGFGGKFSWACRAAWVGAAAAVALGDAAGLFATPARGSTHVPPGRDRERLAGIGERLRDLAADAGEDGFAALRAAGAALRGATLGVVFSDFMAPRGELDALLSALAESGADLAFVHIMTREERAFPPIGAVRAFDPESGRGMNVRAEDVAARYRAHVEEIVGDLDRFARDRGYRYVLVDPARMRPEELWQELLAGVPATRRS
jgi:uncharacterized protein (DUF58 family)